MQRTDIYSTLKAQDLWVVEAGEVKKTVRKYYDTDIQRTQEKSQIQRVEQRHTRWDDKLENNEGKTLKLMRANLYRNRTFEAKGIREENLESKAGNSELNSEP